MTKYMNKNWKAKDIDADGTQAASSGASLGLQRYQFWPRGLKGISTSLCMYHFNP